MTGARLVRTLAAVTAAVTLAAALLAWPGTAEATPIVTSDEVIPFGGGYSDVLFLPDDSRVLLARRDRRVFVYDLATRTGTWLDGTDGVVSLSLAPSGRSVLGASPKGHHLVEVDLASLSVEFHDTGADSCPYDVVGVQDRLVYADLCTGGSAGLFDLDPSTGVTTRRYTPAAPWALSGLTAAPDGRLFATFREGGGQESVARFSMSADGTLVEQQRAYGLPSMATFDRLELVDSGSTLIVQGLTTYLVLDAADLDQRTMIEGRFVAATPTWRARAISHHVEVDDPAAGTLLNSFTDPAVWAFGDGHLAGDGTLLVLGVPDPSGDVRLYRIPMPDSPRPDVVLSSVSDPPLEVGEVLHGDVTVVHGGQPVPFATIMVTVPHGTPQAVVTDADGKVSLAYQTRPGDGDADVRFHVRYDYDSGFSEVDLASTVYRRFASATISAPTSVAVRSTYTVSGVLRDAAGTPIAGEPVVLRTRCSQGTWDEHTFVTGADGQVSTEVTAGACDSYEHQLVYAGSQVYKPASHYTFTTVQRHALMLLDAGGASRYLVPGDEFRTTLQLVNEAGVPQPGLPVRFERRANDGAPTVETYTSNPNGEIELADSVPAEGHSYWTASYPGDEDFRPAAGLLDLRLFYNRLTTSVHLDPVYYGGVDWPVTLTGMVTPVDGPVTVELSGPDGLQTVTTDAAGHFSADVVSHDAGQKEWSVAFAGDGRHTPAATTAVLVVNDRADATPLVMRDQAVYQPGDLARIDLFSGSCCPSIMVTSRTRTRTVVLYSGPYVSTITRRLTDTEFITVSVPGDETWAPWTSRELKLPVALRLRTAPLNPLRMERTTAIFRNGTNPRFRTASSPVAPGSCIRHQVQRSLANGRWSAVTTSGCLFENSAGAVVWRFTQPHVAGQDYRVRSVWAGDAIHPAGRGNWLPFAFRS